MSEVEGVDYVACLECGHWGAKLYRHVDSKHGLSAAAYQARRFRGSWGQRLRASVGTSSTCFAGTAPGPESVPLTATS